jgi:hypothetical protein
MSLSMTRRFTTGALTHIAARIALITALLPGAAIAQSATDAVPSPEAFLGYPLGTDFTTHAGVRDYARQLALDSPSARYIPYGRTVGGRELIQIVIGRPDHLERLDEILARNAELTRLETSDARAREIAASNPAVIYFSYGIHGNESSSSEAALWTAYDLVTEAPAVAGVLDSLILVIDPVANPDGRDRYVHWFRSVVGATPNADPQTREHREPWPGGRFNHYLFDLNRDWAWMTQPETRARIATWWRWNPQVHVDFHEMSPNSTYFFFPAAAPINPIYPDHVLAWGERFGRANAEAFDAHGWRYFTGEAFDMLYPGYGDSWPSLHGSIGMTYEQAGGPSAGLSYARADGDTLTLERRATQHRTAANATLRAAASGKTRLLLDFAEGHRTSGVGSRDFLLVPGPDPVRLDALVDHLLAQGIEVERATSALRIDALAYPGYSSRRQSPAGTALVRARHPRGRLAVTLLQPETELRGDYSYDLSAWSLPYAYGVEAHQTTAPGSGWTRAASAAPPTDQLSLAGYGYLVAPNDASSAALVRYLAAGGSALVLTRGASYAGREWPPGSWFLPLSPGGAERDAIALAGLAPFAVPIAGGLADGGIDLGSERARSLRLPRVALVGGAGIAPTSYGAHWYHLEQHLGFPFDAILLPDLERLDLERYDVVVLPETTSSLTEAATDALGGWVEAGGRLVAVGRASEEVASIAEIELREAITEEGDDMATLDRLLATREERERQEWYESVPGAILPIRLDPGHPLAWGSSFDGAPDRLFVLNTDGRAFEPRAGAETVGSYGPDLRATSGVISAEHLRRLERSAWLITRRVGRGQITLFADDPLFRLFWHSTKPLYLNSILYGEL